MTVGFAMAGSYCTFSKVFPVLEELTREYDILPIISEHVLTTDTRFGTAADHFARIRELCGKPPVTSIPDAEPIGPKKLLDALIVAPCTGNTLAKISHGIADTSVTMSVKSHLRNGRPVILGISSNDGLGAAAENIGRLLNRKHFYFVPFRQDDPVGKPTSLVADFAKLPETLRLALEGIQIQPVLC